MSALVISGLLLSDDMSVLPLGAPANVDFTQVTIPSVALELRA